MTLELTFLLELRSDYHISAGHGLGPSIDSALHRDVDGVPVLRGTTVTGLLRDSLRRLLSLPLLANWQSCVNLGQSSCYDTGSQALCPLCTIFGGPWAPRRWRNSSARPVGLSEPARIEVWTPGETGSLVAPHVRVNPRTRRAEARKLFFREEGDANLRFEFSLHCEDSSDQGLDEAAWLMAAARNLRHLGAGRRRGRGECRVRLIDAIGITSPTGQTAEEYLLERFKGLAGRGPADQESGASQDESNEQNWAVVAADKPYLMLITIRLDEPALISGKGVAGNEFESLDYIPGVALRGALAGRAASRHQLRPGQEVYQAFVNCFCRGGVRFLPLYLANLSGSGEGARLQVALPAPQDILSCETYPGFIEDRDADTHGAASYAMDEDGRLRCPVCKRNGHDDVELKPFLGFLRLGPDASPAWEVERITEMHVAIEPDSGRAAEGALFSFDALAPGQYFCGLLTCQGEAQWQQFCRLVDLPVAGGELKLRLGKASRRGYGQASAWIEPLQIQSPHPWEMAPLDQRVTEPVEGFVMTLLSDTIALDDWGRCLTELEGPDGAAWLERVLGLKVKVVRSFCASRPVDGRNAYLGLPRWRDIAIIAGSSFGLKLVGDQDAATMRKALARAEIEGIGARRNEGFGWVLFNHPLMHNCEGVEPAIVPLPASLAPATQGREHPCWQDQDLDEWRSKLDDVDGKHFRYTEFEALARLLRQAALSGAAATAVVERIGDPDNLIPEAQRATTTIWRSRKLKKSFFRSEKEPGNKGWRQARSLAHELDEQHGIGSRRWRGALELLADYIASEARKVQDGEAQ